MQIDHPLVDAHLETVPRLRTLTTRCLAGGDAENLGGHADRSLHAQLLLLGSCNEVSADFLQGAYLTGCQGDADAVDRGRILSRLLGISFLERLIKQENCVQKFGNDDNLKIHVQTICSSRTVEE